MADLKNTALVFEKRLPPVTRRPVPARWEETESRLEVAVVFTSPAATLAAVRKAGVLACPLNAHISLLLPQVVPYPVPLESPPVLLDFSEHCLREIAAQSIVPTAVHIYLCRDAAGTLQSVLAPHSLVVIGGRKRWWPTREQKLARNLLRSGHEVIFIKTE
jgi:hypothetical protein